MVIYLTGSLRNPYIPQVGARLRAEGFDVYDDWFAAGPEADDKWQEYEQQRGRTYLEALEGYHCWQVFKYDLFHLDRSQAGVLLTPAGKSSHLELGYLIGQGKPGYILLPDEPERWDVMYRYATRVFINEGDLINELIRYRGQLPYDRS